MQEETALEPGGALCVRLRQTDDRLFVSSKTSLKDTRRSVMEEVECHFGDDEEIGQVASGILQEKVARRRNRRIEKSHSNLRFDCFRKH